MPRYTYTITGALDAPEGSTLNETGTGIILPDGRIFKLWEVGEVYDQTQDEDDRYESLSHGEALTELGIFWDGDCSRFAEIEATEQVWPLPTKSVAVQQVAALELLAEAKELLRNATLYEDGQATVLTQDCEALEAAIARVEGSENQ